MAFKNDYIGTKVNSMKTDYEIVWAKMEVAGCRTLHVCSYYKPSEGDEHSVQHFEESLQKLRQSSNSFVIMGRDMNFPGYDWQLKALKPNCKCPTVTYK